MIYNKAQCETVLKYAVDNEGCSNVPCACCNLGKRRRRATGDAYNECTLNTEEHPVDIHLYHKKDVRDACRAYIREHPELFNADEIMEKFL